VRRFTFRVYFLMLSEAQSNTREKYKWGKWGLVVGQTWVVYGETTYNTRIERERERVIK